MTHRSDGGLRIVPCTLEQANDFVRRLHRHNKPVVGSKFCVGVTANALVGVAIVGRPVAPALDDGFTAEITRVCTDGTRNAASMLYGACRKAARAMGYDRIFTYTLPEEGGASLRAAGWTLLGERGGGSWSRPSRPRVDTAPLQAKLLWEAAGRL